MMSMYFTVVLLPVVACRAARGGLAFTDWYGAAR
jgi:hypothetical protein